MKWKSLFSPMEVQEKPVKNTIDVSWYVVWLQRHQHLKMPVKWHKKWFTWLSLKLYQKRGNRLFQRGQFHTLEELSSGQSEVAGNKCRAGILTEYSTLQWRFIYLCFQALRKLSYIFSSTFPWSCNIWFDILASWTAKASAQGDSLVAIWWTFSLSN